MEFPPWPPLSSRICCILWRIAFTLVTASPLCKLITIFSLTFAGNSVRTSFFNRRIITNRDSTACNSPGFDDPFHPNRDPAQYRCANSLNFVNTTGRRASACEKISTGRESAGVPVKQSARVAFFKSGITALVRCAFESFRKCDSSQITTLYCLWSNKSDILVTSEYGTIANFTFGASSFFCSAPVPTAAMNELLALFAFLTIPLQGANKESPSHFTNACSHAPRNDVGTKIKHGHSSLYAAAHASACTVFPKPIWSPIKHLPPFPSANRTPSR
mmetsp:Transcript_488/g.1922  ORF Transcript_488/g.1922 Transcript_488/m.1922 type:complete len:274 (+) Transcript_488:912-1733(+)